MKRHRRNRPAWTIELLESRCLLSGVPGADADDFQAMIVAGESPDSPALRVDANTATSPFAGVGSLQIATRRGNYICTGTPIDTYRVLTAAHCVDINNDGVSNKKDGIKSITFNLNLDTDAGTDQVDIKRTAASWVTHPDYTGFNRPSINDDLAVITLGGAGVPASVPKYSLVTSDMVAGTTHLYLVGYGRSGDGVNGYTTNASYTVKRRGENIADAFYGQDDAGRSAANEVFRFDFDGPSGNGTFGGPTLGNDKETTLGGGDSGGPSFILLPGSDPLLASSYQLVGVNTFTQGSTAPKFGSLGGGINVFPYRSWILAPSGTSSASSGGSGGRAATIRVAIGTDGDSSLNGPQAELTRSWTATPFTSLPALIATAESGQPTAATIAEAGTSDHTRMPVRLAGFSTVTVSATDDHSAIDELFASPNFLDLAWGQHGHALQSDL